MSAYVRTLLRPFILANSAYINATVAFYTVDITTGLRTTTLANIYAGITGTLTVTNPVTLDSEGKSATPLYIDEPVIGVINATGLSDSETGIIRPALTPFAGAWASGTDYFESQLITDGSNGNLYQAVADYTAGASVGADVSNGNLFLLVDAVAVAAAVAAAASATLDAAAAAASASAALNSQSASSVSAAAAAASAAAAAISAGSVDGTRIQDGANTTFIDTDATAGTINASAGAKQVLTANNTTVTLNPNNEDIDTIIKDDAGNQALKVDAGTGVTTINKVRDWIRVVSILGDVLDDTYDCLVSVPEGFTVLNSMVVSKNGTGTGTFEINGTPLGGTAHSISTTPDTQSHSSANVAAATNTVTLVITGAATLEDVHGYLEIEASV